MGRKRKHNKNKNNYNGTSLSVVRDNSSVRDDSSVKDDSFESTVLKLLNEDSDTSDSLKDNTNNTANTNKSTLTKSSYYGYYSTRVNYNYKGVKNETKFQDFVDICKLKQMELKEFLTEELFKADYTDVVSGDGYLYAKGTEPFLLTAHMDTVHKETVKDFYEYYDKEKNRHILSSPQGIGGDDRCGVYMILQIIKTHKCSVLFCEDEETGGIGSSKFCKTELVYDLSNLNYLIELDRANGTDAVFYDCVNYEFIDFIEDNTKYKEAYGSFSDISNLSPECKIASVNLSCGYYNAHTTSEYVIVEEMLNTIEVVKKLLDVECSPFEYVELARKYRSYGNYYGGSYKGYYDYDDDDDYYYENYYGNYNRYGYDGYPSTSKTSEERSLLIHVLDESCGECRTYVSNGRNCNEAFGKFFLNNPEYCYNDIFDYEFYDSKYYDDGWYEYLY